MEATPHKDAALYRSASFRLLCRVDFDPFTSPFDPMDTCKVAPGPNSLLHPSLTILLVTSGPSPPRDPSS